MNWKLEWKWESDACFGEDMKYFKTAENAMDFIEKLKENPYRKITSMYLIYTMRLI